MNNKPNTTAEDTEDIDLLEPETECTENETAHDVVFWVTKYREHQETGRRYVESIKINKLKLLKVFYLLGYRRIDIDDMPIFVKIENNRVIKRSNINQVIDAFFDFLNQKEYWLDDDNTLSIDKLKEKFLDSPGSYFKEDKLFRLNMFSSEKIEFNKDTLSEKFLYYKNGFVRIDKTGVRFNDYANLDKYIWESEVLPRNFSFIDYKDCYVSQFIDRVCKVMPQI